MAFFRKENALWSIVGILLLALVTAAVIGRFFALGGPGGMLLYFTLVTPFVLAIVGFAYWVFLWRQKPKTRFAVVLASTVGPLLVLLVALIFLVAGPISMSLLVNKVKYSDPIGVGNDVAPGPCKTTTLAKTSSSSGLVAEARETSCTGTWDGDLAAFVFLHPRGKPCAKDNLVFRFREDVYSPRHLLSIKWIGSNALLISASGMSEITYQLMDMNGVGLNYNLRFSGLRTGESII